MTHSVLLVDDEVNVLHGCLRALRKQPYEIVTAGGGEEAMEILTSREIDLVISDEKMPGMVGTDLLAWVAEHYPEIVRILLTGQATLDTAMRAINDGQVYRFLTKPCENLELVTTIRKALEYKDLICRNQELLEETRRQVKDIERARRHAEEQAHQLQIRSEETRLARIKAEQASESKSMFLANMSHEIRTPMNAIIGFSRLLLKEPLTEQQHDNVLFVTRAADALLNLINDILDFSKIEAGEFTITPDDCDVEELLDDIMKMSKSLIGDKPVLIDYEIDSNIPQVVYVDSARLRQVFTNLVSNAIKFTDNGIVTIRTAIVTETHQTVTLRFEVSDTGIGIPPDRHEAIFDSFTQADGTTTRKYGGTGLGLAISKRLVSLMGGDIGLRSEMGQGSTFWFTVCVGRCSEESIALGEDSSHGDIQPCQKDSAAGHRSEARLLPADNGVGKPSQSYRLLVVDDALLNRRVLIESLKGTGCVIDEACDGIEALSALEAKSYDLVFMDIQMPSMDGLEATRRIREKEQAAGGHVPIIAFTACVLKGDRERCLEAGCDDYLAKPFTPNTLYDALSHHLPGIRDLRHTFRQPVAQSSVQDRRTAVTRVPLRKIGGESVTGNGGFLADCLGEVLQLHEHLKERNWRELEEQACTLKRLAGQKEMEGVSRNALRVELAARRSDAGQVESAVRKLEESLQSRAAETVQANDAETHNSLATGD